MGKTIYICNPGELNRKDNTVCFRREGKPIYLPIENIREMYIFSEISLNTKLLAFLSKYHIITHFYDYYGHYVGTFYPKEKYMSGRLLIAQVEFHQKNRLMIAKNIVKGIGLNIHEVLYHYYRHLGTEELKNILDWIKDEFINSVDSCKTIEQIMYYEGCVWEKFYHSFQYFIHPDFILNKRVRRPPDNPINALISFGNSLLYTKTITAISKTHLEQSISFLHEPSEQRFSLSLDICEVFKPIIVFKVIFSLVDRKQIQVEKHFDKKLNYCILNEEGRRIFVEAFDKKMQETIKHGKMNRKVSYETLLKLDCYKLIKQILENKEFFPFSIKENF